VNLFESELRVIAVAEELAATLGSDPVHSVAAAAMDTSGKIHTAVNVYHFTGGPCAELVVLGAAAAAHAGPLLTIAAAGDHGRGLIAPCGRCRQALLDLHPDVMVAVPGDSGPDLLPIRDLLPGAYLFPDANPRRIIRFNKRYYQSVADGTKTTTTRYNDPIAVGRALLVFEDDEHHRTLDAEVTGIKRYRLDTITAGQAGHGPDTTTEQIRAGLRSHYPDLPDDAAIDVVSFVLVPAPEVALCRSTMRVPGGGLPRRNCSPADVSLRRPASAGVSVAARRPGRSRR
jgi:cytidine deaminase